MIVASGNQARLILIGTAVLLSLGMGIRQSLGLFLTSVTRDLALTAADFTLAVAIQNIVWGLSQALVGSIADRSEADPAMFGTAWPRPRASAWR
jgi:sugar phosphate permease